MARFLGGIKILRRVYESTQCSGSGSTSRHLHGSPSASNMFGLGNNMFGGGFGGSGGQQQAQEAAQVVSRLPKGSRANMERCADSISYIKDLSLKQKLVVKKFINICMSDGKKTKARTLCFKAFELLANRGDVIKILEAAIENVKPICEVKRVRVAGATHNVPAAIAKHRQETLSMRWILEAARKRWSVKKSSGLGRSLADEIYDASRKAGAARKKRDDLHRLAEANRTLAHYRWW